jgi:hypothetical protein
MIKKSWYVVVVGLYSIFIMEREHAPNKKQMLCLSLLRKIEQKPNFEEFSVATTTRFDPTKDLIM